jgi:hypothetical protein
MRLLQERMARGFATSLARFADGLLPIRASGTAVEPEARVRLRTGDRATRRVDADFELIMGMPEGHAERWRLDWNLQGVDIAHHRAEFDFDVPMAFEIPSEVFDGA